MDETTDDKVVQIKPPNLDAGYRQQRYRRKPPKKRTAKTSLSEAAITSKKTLTMSLKKASSRKRKMTTRPMTW
jgi:hypothetical protein